MSIKALWFGRIPYMDGLRIQETIFQRMKAAGSSPSCHHLCLFEHHPAYTVGLRGHVYPLEEEERLKRTGAEFHRVKRGGLVTFHGPGQLVGYPLFDLHSMHVDSSGVGVSRFVRLVEQVLIDLLTTHYAIKGVGRTTDPGVWVDEMRKIGALGMQVRSGITSHGFALNCNTDLSWFRNIVPCGIEGKFATSITQELGEEVGVQDVLEPVCRQVEQTFQLPVDLQRSEPDAFMRDEVASIADSRN